MVKENIITKKRQEGFTIIEVLIVLAIAGLIILIVLLAVPALQRNSRNTARTADAALITAAISDCMANRNGQTASCDTTGELTSNGGLDTARLKQLTTVAYATAAPNSSTANFQFGQKCTDPGDGFAAGTARQAAIIYGAEGSGSSTIVKCIDV